MVKEGVEVRESVSGNVDSLVSNETSTGLLTKFSSPGGYLFVTKYGVRTVFMECVVG